MGLTMARPIGPAARTVLHALALGPLSMASLANAAGLTVYELRQVCYRMCVAGRIVATDSTRSDRCRRPVALYAR